MNTTSLHLDCTFQVRAEVVSSSGSAVLSCFVEKLQEQKFASKKAPSMTPSFPCWGRRISFRDLCQGQQLRLVLWWSWRSTRGQLTIISFVCYDFWILNTVCSCGHVWLVAWKWQWKRHLHVMHLPSKFQPCYFQMVMKKLRFKVNKQTLSWIFAPLLYWIHRHWCMMMFGYLIAISPMDVLSLIYDL